MVDSQRSPGSAAAATPRLANQLRMAVALLGAGRRPRWLIVLALSVIASVLEIIGGVFIVSILSGLTGSTASLSLPILGNLSDRLRESDDNTVLAVSAGVAVVFFVLRGAFAVAQTYVQFRVVHNAGAALAGRLLDGYLSMPYESHLRRNSAELMTHTTEAVSTVAANIFVPGVILFSEMCVVLAITGFLLVEAPLATLLSAVVLVPTVGLVLKIVQPSLASYGEGMLEEVRASYKAVQQGLHGARDILLSGNRRYFLAEFTRSRYAYARFKYLQQTLLAAPRLGIETVVTVFVLVFLAFNSARGASTDDSIQVLGLFAYAAFRIMPAVIRIVQSLNNFRYGQAALAIVNEELAVTDALRPPDDSDMEPLSFEEAIRLTGVRFRYAGAEIDAVRDIDLEIRAGTSTGIVGPTGGGKSTIVDLVIGLLVPTVGSVTIDGEDLGPLGTRWHRRLGVVSQSVYLLDDTIRRNVAFGVPDDEIDAGALIEALQASRLDSWLRTLPDGVETILGERGVRLSGGQRQRIAIARALYRRPDVLVFDEGTSALDTVTEAEIVAAVEDLRGDHTILMVAHRIGTVRACDEILVVDDGRIVERGTYDELVASSARFRALLSAHG